MSTDVISVESPASELWRGAKAAMPVAVAALPFGLLFGALAIDNGLSVFETTLMSAVLFAGASQMVGIELFGQTIAPWMVVLSIFAVNFRHVLYSAAIGRRIGHWPVWQQALAFFFLTDPQYAEAERRGEERGEVGVYWYTGMAVAMYVSWVSYTFLGATFGNLIPDPHALGIDFLLPIYFLGLVMDFRDRPLWLPVVGVSAVASIIAFNVLGSPWHVSVGAVAGIILAAAVPVRESGGKA